MGAAFFLGAAFFFDAVFFFGTAFFGAATFFFAAAGGCCFGAGLTAAAAFAAAVATECTANAPPCGSTHMVIRSPPGTSIGPDVIRPPSFVISAVALSALATLT